MHDSLVDPGDIAATTTCRRPYRAQNERSWNASDIVAKARERGVNRLLIYTKDTALPPLERCCVMVLSTSSNTSTWLHGVQPPPCRHPIRVHTRAAQHWEGLYARHLLAHHLDIGEVGELDSRRSERARDARVCPERARNEVRGAHRPSCGCVKSRHVGSRGRGTVKPG